MAAKRKPKLQSNEFYTALQTFFGAGGAFVEAGKQYRGDSEIVRLHPMHFALTSGGQAAIDAASEAVRLDIGLAQKNRELAWYGPKVDPPPQPARVRCVKGFQHGRLEVAVGSVWLASHRVVASAPSAFVPVVEDA